MFLNENSYFLFTLHHFELKIFNYLLYLFRFYNKFEIPRVIGVIDGTHVAIVPPNTADDVYPEHVYVNRKGYHSINTQLVSLNIIYNKNIHILKS